MQQSFGMAKRQSNDGLGKPQSRDRRRGFQPELFSAFIASPRLTSASGELSKRNDAGEMRLASLRLGVFALRFEA